MFLKLGHSHVNLVCVGKYVLKMMSDESLRVDDKHMARGKVLVACKVYTGLNWRDIGIM